MEIKHGNFAGSYLNFRDVNIIFLCWGGEVELGEGKRVGLIMPDLKTSKVRLAIFEVCPIS